MQRMPVTGPSLPGGSVVAIGMFDGVHLGHRQVLAHLRALGARRALPTVVVTFDPHPRALLRPDEAPAMLVPLEERLELLASTGLVDHVLVLPFDRVRSQETAEDFVDRLLCARLGAKALVVGANFACGRGRQGTVERLRELGRSRGFDVRPVPLHAAPVADELGPCSSSVTRRLIQRGDVQGAARLLDRPVEFRGQLERVAADDHAVADAVLPAGLCVPPPARYTGAVRRHAPSAEWTPLELQLCDEGAGARFRFRHPGVAAGGERVAVRLFGRAGT